LPKVQHILKLYVFYHVFAASVFTGLSVRSFRNSAVSVGTTLYRQRRLYHRERLSDASGFYFWPFDTLAFSLCVRFARVRVFAMVCVGFVLSAPGACLSG
jgi:hypothetical protein